MSFMKLWATSILWVFLLNLYNTLLVWIHKSTSKTNGGKAQRDRADPRTGSEVCSDPQPQSKLLCTQGSVPSWKERWFGNQETWILVLILILTKLHDLTKSFSCQIVSVILRLTWDNISESGIYSLECTFYLKGWVRWYGWSQGLCSAHLQE